MQPVTGSAGRYTGKGRIFWRLWAGDIWSGFIIPITLVYVRISGAGEGEGEILTDDTTYSGFNEADEFMLCVAGFD